MPFDDHPERRKHDIIAAHRWRNARIAFYALAITIAIALAWNEQNAHDGCLSGNHLRHGLRTVVIVTLGQDPDPKARKVTRQALMVFADRSCPPGIPLIP